jgi:hypothetical protein
MTECGVGSSALYLIGEYYRMHELVVRVRGGRQSVFGCLRDQSSGCRRCRWSVCTRACRCERGFRGVADPCGVVGCGDVGGVSVALVVLGGGERFRQAFLTAKSQHLIAAQPTANGLHPQPRTQNSRAEQLWLPACSPSRLSSYLISDRVHNQSMLHNQSQEHTK